MTKLIESPVLYVDSTHQYFLDGRELNGITSVIEKYIGNGKYAKLASTEKGRAELDVAQNVGKKIHEAIQNYEMQGTAITEPIALPYIELKKLIGGKIEAVEYVVSDNDNYASPIDMVNRVDDNTFDIIDIKTNSKCPTETATWQLSFYYHYFLAQNPTAKIRHLIIAWFPKKPVYGKAKFVKVDPIDFGTLRMLFNSALENEDVQLVKDMIKDVSLTSCVMKKEKTESCNIVPVIENGTLPANIVSLANEIEYTCKMAEEWANKKAELVEKVSSAMEEFNVKNWTLDGHFQFSRTAESTRKTFDAKAFKSAHPEIDIEKFYNISQVKGSTKLKLF